MTCLFCPKYDNVASVLPPTPVRFLHIARTWSRSLSFFSALFCGLLPRRLFYGSPKAHCQKSISVKNLTSTAWRTLGLFGAFPTLLRWGGIIDPWALRFLVIREINCGDWLARGYMPAHQHCDLFYPLGWGCDWVYHKLDNAPILRSGTGSGFLSG